jgi:hypothetical protein
MSIEEQSRAGAGPQPQHRGAEEAVMGPHMGPFTAGDPHVSIQTAP